ncbi:MAG: methionyl-tRNA formyltransferase [Chloroflexaceae bacterium]|nr:methionyl-tRNA formyltransferase [Chloroflexaceae bacterium]
MRRYGEILRRNVLNLLPLGYLNIHPSLLPLYRGPAPVAGAILAGDSETGVTIMKLTRQMDSGPILAQATVPLLPDARTGPLTEELFRLGSAMLLQVLPRYAQGQLHPQPQDESQASFTQLLHKNDGLIDWSQPAVVIERMTRAYDPWPMAFTIWRGQHLKVRVVRALPSRHDTSASPGTLIALAEGPLVVTGGGLCELLEVHPAGKRPMSAAQWLSGQRDALGGRFERLSV